MSTKDTACVWSSFLKTSRSRSGHKRSPLNESHKHAVQHLFSVSFCTQISMATVILPYDVTRSDFWFRSGQGQVKFSNQYCHTASTCFLLRISSVSQICHCFSSTMHRTPENRNSKNGVINFSKYIANTFFIGNIGFVCGKCLLTQRNHKVI